ncbi:MAG TPA: family 78 glycoside hydrolase catalytic domain [Acidimicrobiales bacterium]|nr:family 78 glycoside hydrolase catalytic domain [Acidimicrobiales bacterium]
MPGERLDRRTFLGHGVRAGAVLGFGHVTLAELGASSAAAARHGDPVAVERVTVNGVVAPIGVDPDDVSFAWLLRSGRRGAHQRAYRIEVLGGGTTVWDSGPVASARQAFVAYAGPTLAGDTAYAVRVTVDDDQGITSGPAIGAFVTGLRPADWTGAWLQPAPSDPDPDRHTYVRGTTRLGSSPIVRATAYVAAAHKYELFVNGASVASGPSFCYPDEQYYEATDVTSYLRAGSDNVVGFLHHWYGPGQGRPASAPGLLVQVAVHHRDGSREVLASDGSWREHPGEWLPAPYRNSDGGDYVEVIDGRATPLGWSSAGYDDRGWTSPAVLGPVGTSPFTGLYAQRTRIVEEPLGPVRVHRLADGAVVADFGKVYAARPTVDFRAGLPGRTVTMHVGYELDPDGHVSTTHGTQGSDLSFTYIQRAGAQTFLPYTFLGFRYLQIDDPGEPISAGQLRAVTRHSAMPEPTAAAFTTSNAMLNAVWGLTTHSALFTSHEQFVDTPTREKGQFLWDASQESQGIMRAFGDQNQSWQALRDFARSQRRYWPDGRVNCVYPNGDGARDIPTFTEMCPEWVWRYWTNTGDLDTVTALHPTLINLAGYLAGSTDPATGLITGLTVGSNGDPVYGYDQNVTVDTTVNVLGVNAYRRVAQVAALVGDIAGQASATSKADALLAAVNGQLVRTDGIYVDGRHADGSLSPHASQLANALALALEVAPPANVAPVGAYVASLGIDVSPQYGLLLLRGLHAAGLDHDLVATLTNRRIPGWAHIVAVGGTFTWETWVPNDVIGDSMSHGWGSSALVAMQEVLLGASLGDPPTEGGGALLVLTPPPSGLAASGTVPTVSGPAAVAWRRSSGHLELTLGLPANAGARVQLPTSRPAAATEGGVPIGRAPGVTVLSSTNTGVTVLLGSGAYRFAAPFS